MAALARLFLCLAIVAVAAGASPAQDRRLVRTTGQLTPLPPATNDAGSWPSFRGPNAAGVADGQHLPDTWSLETGENIRWRVPIAGLAHSSPIVWGDRIFVTSAVSSRSEDALFVPGAYGAGTPSDDRSSQKWVVYCLDRNTGRVIWERVAFEGRPVEKRHIKSTYASATPATDGRIVVAWFGSQGVYAYNFDGTLRWKVDLGHLDVGAYDVPTLEWGTASSPIIWNDSVFLQADTHQDDFMLALDLATGAVRWKTDRDELPSWGTPTVVPVPGGGHQLVANGSNFIRGYDPASGRELWRLGKSSQITVPTPIFADGLIVVASGRAPERPIFVVRPRASGDITLPAGQTSSDAVAWSRTGRGPYMPTPVVYDHVLYVVANNGVMHAYQLASGEQLYEGRLPRIGSGFNASPVAADKRIYVSSEDGDITLLAAGSTLDVIATNSLGEPIMATPALSRGTMYVRTSMSLVAIGEAPVAASDAERARRGLIDTRAKNFVAFTAGGASLTDGRVTLTVAAPAASALAGTWRGTLAGSPIPIDINVRAEATSVSGDLTAGATTVKIIEGRIGQSELTFVVAAPNAGRTVTFAGTLKGDEITFVRTVQAPAGAPAGGGGIFGAAGPASFTLRRASGK